MSMNELYNIDQKLIEIFSSRDLEKYSKDMVWINKYLYLRIEKISKLIIKLIRFVYWWFFKDW